MGIFIHEEYVFRTGSWQTLTTLVESDRQRGDCRVTAIGSGGGDGMFNIDWGSERAGEHTIIESIQNLIHP
ncbi:hypothetical protein EU538_01875 [Candidatus Thorarchaeota archaeon]|nr:MAG: hypothetical protein EU538_01875 [Candidatus Thorarchaeota archaeon]